MYIRKWKFEGSMQSFLSYECNREVGEDQTSVSTRTSVRSIDGLPPFVIYGQGRSAGRVARINSPLGH